MDRILVTYAFIGEDPKAIADVIRVEQTIEFPYDLAPEWIQEQVVGKVEEITSSNKTNHLITISYNPDTAGRANTVVKCPVGKCFALPGCEDRRSQTSRCNS